MIEKRYSFNQSTQKLVEKILEDENAAINHIILPKNDSLPEHYTNSHVYLIIVKGKLTLRAGDEEERSYHSGLIINIPYQTKMTIANLHDELLEFFVVKAPSPKQMIKR